MVLGVPLSELLLLAALIIVAGVVTGILAGLFGIGGGAIIVPVLYEVFRVLGVPDEVLKLAFVLVGSVIALKLLVGRDSWRLADDLPGRAAMSGYGFFVGLAASLMGISGGSIANMILTLHGRPIHSAVATSAALGVPITVAGTIGYVIAGLPQQALLPPFSIGFVSLIGFALMAPGSPTRCPGAASRSHSAASC